LPVRHFCQCPARLSKSVLLLARLAVGRLMTTTSSPPNAFLCWRKDSRTTLFRRFRWTAKRQFFLEIARPSLPAFLPFARDSTVNSVSRLRFDFSNTRWKEPASSSRVSLVNRQLEMSSFFGLLSVVTEIAARRLSSIVHDARYFTATAAHAVSRVGDSGFAARSWSPCAL
jgi:hypothetical protein